jgi:major membrane immunogen (membrane-anchored lipoprotein)
MNKEKEIKNYYLQEFSLFDGEYNVTFNILDVNTEKMTITVAVTKAGKIYVTEYDLMRDKKQNLYFQYGVDNTKVNVNDFETIED